MKTNHKSGFSLIEIMVASLLLAVLAIGGAAVLYHTGAVIQNQEQKRMAVDQAEERMELIKRTRYSLMRPAIDSIVYYYVDQDQDDLLESGDGELQDALITETQKQFPMVTKITRIPPPSANEAEYLRIGVTVTYDIAGQQVILGSVIVPDL